VEQLCTRIAVLNQGRKVFEGTLADTKRRDQWVRLEVADFGKAVTDLREANLITEERDGNLVALRRSGNGPDRAAAGRTRMAVYEIAKAEETLESFYLGLMKPNGEAKN